MNERDVFKIVKELYLRGFDADPKTAIRPEVLREVVTSITRRFDKGATTRAVNSLIDADILKSDYGIYRWGWSGKKMLGKLGYCNDSDVLKAIKPPIELVERKEVSKIKADVVVSHHADFPDLPQEELTKLKKLQKKPEIDFNDAPDNAE